MEKKTRVTMLDVARAANVTPQTVSRAFRNAPDISAETRERILRIAAELNYVKNSTASSLRCGNSKLIVVIYDILINIYFSIMIDHLQTSLLEQGYSVLVLSVAERRLNRSAYEFAVSHNAAGIVSFLEPDEEIGELVSDFDLPVLLIGRRTELEEIDYLRTDDEEGGRLAARKLLECGCKHPLYFSVDLSVSCAFDRYNGFKEELLKAGIEDVPVLVDSRPNALQDMVSAMSEGTMSEIDGIFCFSDMLAFDALYMLEKYEVGGIYVVGFDNIQEELHIPNRLTSVGTDKRLMAQRAAEIIVRRVENGKAERIAESVGVFLQEGYTA